MAIVTVADILMHAQRFEKQLADYYKSLSAQTVKDGVRLLTDYMSRHRVRLNTALSKLPEATVKRISREPLRFEPEVADCRCFEGIALSREAGADEVLDVAIRLDRCLMSLYSQAAAQTADEEVQALFESLIAAEEQDEVELRKIKATNYF